MKSIDIVYGHRNNFVALENIINDCLYNEIIKCTLYFDNLLEQNNMTKKT